ncbi:serine hydrolase [Aquimarina sp. U1-2]|uniref:serine hydrolase domain-containing protein n=1 Tax=Aquimarina sp. U1-2 TaxID=2823141 RepID=UPI001AECD41B|nr:serine hydrolase domain-containing protein [Aquimarina sp. U1-2]MBP2831534.1 serine hydrolase [Aquimarina sp. U1-2]
MNRNTNLFLNRIIRTVIAILVCSSTLSGCQNDDDSYQPLTADADLQTAKDEAIRNIVSKLNNKVEAGLYGVAKLTFRDTIILHLAYGMRNRAANESMQTTTGFDIGSLTKAITAATILKLEEQGELNLSDTVGQYVSGISSNLSTATIEHLLDHRSGLPEYLGDDYELLTKQGAISRLNSYTLSFQPGSQEAYSNPGYSLLGIIVEEATGQSFEQVMRTLVLEPAGTTSIGYRLPNWQLDDLAVGYVNNTAVGTPLDLDWLQDGPSWTLRGNGGLLSTTEDIEKWFNAVFKGDVLGNAALEKFSERFAGEGPYGLRSGEAGGDDATGFNAQHENWSDIGVSFTLFTSRSSFPAEEVWDAIANDVTRLAEIAFRQPNGN